MRGFAEHQPITAMADTARILSEVHPAAAVLGSPLSSYLPLSLLWSLGIVAVFMPLAVRRLRRG
jgi:hypothetical protein